MTREEQAKNMTAYREALQAIYGNDQGMIDYCMKETEIVVSVRGMLFPIEKRKVEKHFCFGYSDCGQGQDYMAAIREADKARNDSTYFKAQNLKYYASWIENLDSTDAIALCESYGKHSPIRSLRAFAWWEALESVGGEARLEDLKGAMVTSCRREVYFLTDAERQTVKEAFEQAMKAQEKKLDAYLKRYGTSKIKAWTYWLDD